MSDSVQEASAPLPAATAPIPNELRISAKRKPRVYVMYALQMLRPQPPKPESDNAPDADTENVNQEVETQPIEPLHRFVVLRAMGGAIAKAVSVAEILKRRVEGLHQNTSIYTERVVEEIDEEDGGQDAQDLQDSVEANDSTEGEGTGSARTRRQRLRNVPAIRIWLSLDAPEDTSAPGYQEPLTQEERIALSIQHQNVPGRNHNKHKKKRRNRNKAAPKSQDSVNDDASPNSVENTTAAEATDVIVDLKKKVSKKRNRRRNRRSRAEEGSAKPTVQEGAEVAATDGAAAVSDVPPTTADPVAPSQA